MWKIFKTNQLNTIEALQSINDWKHSIFNQMDIKVKTYFARTVVSNFDNRMLFQQKRSAHDNLLESLSDSEKQMSNVNILFQSIKLYWMPSDYDESYIISYGLPDEASYLPEPKHNLTIIDANASFNQQKLHELEHKSWSTLVFDMSLCDYYKGWINYIPNFDERCILQTKAILMNTLLKNSDYNLLEQIELENNIKNHSSFNELNLKIEQAIPKINKFLVEEWRNLVINGEIPTNIKKSHKI